MDDNLILDRFPEDESLAPPPPPIEDAEAEIIKLGFEEDEVDLPLRKWPSPVDGAELFREIQEYVCEFVLLPKDGDVLMPLLIVATYCVHASCLDVAPRVVITAPDPQCGKTTAMKVVASLVFRAHPTLQFTQAKLAEAAHDKETLLLDECHNILHAGASISGQFRAMANGGFEKKFSRKETLRSGYNLFTMMFLAGIGSEWVSRELATRSIRFDMMPALHEPLSDFVEHQQAERARVLKAKIARWLVDTRKRIKEHQPNVDGFNNRARDLATALLKVAETMEVGDSTREALPAYLTVDTIEGGRVALADIAALLRDPYVVVTDPTGRTSRLGDNDFILTSWLTTLLPAHYPEREEYDGFTDSLRGAQRLGKLLRNYKIEPQQQRIDAKRVLRGYPRKLFKPWFNRYGLLDWVAPISGGLQSEPTATTATETSPQPTRKRYWLLPPEKREEWEREFGPFDFDPCPYPRPEGFDGLAIPWGLCTLVNAPFVAKDADGRGRGLTAWARKAIEEHRLNKTVLMVCPSSSGILALMIEAGAEIRPQGRIKWLEAQTGEPMPSPPNVTLFVLRAGPATSPHMTEPAPGDDPLFPHAKIAAAKGSTTRANRLRTAIGEAVQRGEIDAAEVRFISGDFWIAITAGRPRWISLDGAGLRVVEIDLSDLRPDPRNGIMRSGRVQFFGPASDGDFKRVRRLLNEARTVI